MPYQRADTTWFAACNFGIGLHWTAQSMPVRGPQKTFPQAVHSLDVESLVERVADCGANYLLFTATHARQMLPAPCAAMQPVLPGRTCSRDLLGELADACRQKGLHLILYYNHSCNNADDPAWEQAVGYHDRCHDAFADRLCSVITELSDRYGRRVAAWWFDSPYSLDASGPVKAVTTEMYGFQFPWQRFTAAAKTGHPQRLVTYNPGDRPEYWSYMYTSHQDYLAGEANALAAPPTSRWDVNGLQNHRWICLDNTAWVHHSAETPLHPARFSLDELAAYFRAAAAACTPVTVNVDVDQNGQMSPESLDLLRLASAGLARPLQAAPGAIRVAQRQD